MGSDNNGDNDATTDGLAEGEAQDVVEEEVDVSRDRELTREGSGNKHPDFDPTKKFGNTGKKRLKAGTIAPGLVIVSYTYGIM